MTIPTTISAVTYAGNGVTTQFDWTFPIPSGALAVYRTENNVAVLVDPSAYSVSGLDDPNGGTVSFAQAPALGQAITIKRDVILTQDMALVTGSAFYAEVVEGAFDKATMQIQQLAEEMGRAIKSPIGSDIDPASYLDSAAQSAAAASAAASSSADSAVSSAASAISSESSAAASDAFAASSAASAQTAVDAAGQAKAAIPGLTIMFTDTLRQEVERATGGKRTIIRNVDGVPSVFYVLPRFHLSALDASWPDSPHPAFILNGEKKSEIFIGCYEASVVNNKAVSLGGVYPATAGAWQDGSGAGIIFDNVVSLCRASGNNYHLMTNAEWAAIALWCWKMGYNPSGNSWYGINSKNPIETGAFSAAHSNLTLGSDASNRPVLTGSGPNTWYHDGTSQGIADLAGNAFTWIAGCRVRDGMLQVIPDNNAALPTANFGDVYSGSSDLYWKAVSPTSGGVFVDPRSGVYTKFYVDGSYKAGGTAAPDGYGSIRFNTSVLHPDDGSVNIGSAYDYFTGIAINSSVTTGVNTERFLKSLALLPMGSGIQQGRCYSRVPGDRPLIRGGAYYYENPSDSAAPHNVGLFSYTFANLKNVQGYPGGFRVCCYA